MTTLANNCLAYTRGKSFFGTRFSRLTTKLPVPVHGSRMVTPSAPSASPNSAFSTSSTLAHMKSTIGCGVYTMPCVSAVFTEKPWKNRSYTVFRKCCFSWKSSISSAAFSMAL